MANVHRVTHRVQFRDTDAAGIMHFSTYFTYMEEAEHDFLRQVGLSVVVEHDDQTLSWPRASASCEFAGALRFEDCFDVDVRLVRMGEKSVTYDFVFEKAGTRLAHGKVVAVCCRLESGQKPVSVAIPEPFRKALLPYLHESTA